jgi:hypothetical protein
MSAGMSIGYWTVKVWGPAGKQYMARCQGQIWRTIGRHYKGRVLWKICHSETEAREYGERVGRRFLKWKRPN